MADVSSLHRSGVGNTVAIESEQPDSGNVRLGGFFGFFGSKGVELTGYLSSEERPKQSLEEGKIKVLEAAKKEQTLNYILKEIKELTATITQATQASVFATEESTKLAADTTASARKIAQVIRQQQRGTEQVTQAMDEVAKIAFESSSASKQTVATSRNLIRLSETLQSLVGQFSDGTRSGQAPKP